MIISKKEIKSICVYGVGGVGGYFGGKIAHRLNQAENKNYQLYFIARGSHLQKIKENGLILNTDEQRGLVCKPTLAAEKIDEIPEVDLILVCVKSYDLEPVIDDIGKNIGNSTIIIPLSNGVDIYQRIRSVLTRGIVLPACVYVGSHIEKPGVVTQSGGDGVILFGRDPKNPDITPTQVLDFFGYTGINYKWLDNSFPAVWEKFIFIAAFGLVTAYSGEPLGRVVGEPVLKNQVKGIMAEIVLLARCEGVDLRETIISESLEKANNFPCETKTSYQRDIEQNKEQNEGDLFGGTIIRMGKKHGVPTPVTENIYTALICKKLV